MNRGNKVRRDFSPLMVSVVGGVSFPGAVLEVLAGNDVMDLSPALVWACLAVSAAIGAVVFCLTHQALSFRLIKRRLSAEISVLYRENAAWSYGVFLLTWFGLWGIFVPFTVMAWLFFMTQSLTVLLAMRKNNAELLFSSTGWPAFLFLISGHAAIIYQIAWHRVLFTVFGMNIESITVVVSVFMFGLGLGSLAGGWLGTRFPRRLAHLFTVCEIIIGGFGIFSVQLIRWVGDLTLGSALFTTAAACYALLALPTLIMGATLPILVTFLHRRVSHVGRSVGVMYSVNTLGSALACFITVDALFPIFGLYKTVFVAAAVNLTVALGMLRYNKAVDRLAARAVG